MKHQRKIQIIIWSVFHCLVHTDNWQNLHTLLWNDAMTSLNINEVSYMIKYNLNRMHVCMFAMEFKGLVNTVKVMSVRNWQLHWISESERTFVENIISWSISTKELIFKWIQCCCLFQVKIKISTWLGTCLYSWCPATNYSAGCIIKTTRLFIQNCPSVR